MKFEISKLALEDINSIWLYTMENWSKNQANKYYKLLIKEINALRKNPLIGRPIEDVKNHHRIIQVKSHLIVYKISNNIIYADRILHQSVDIENQLIE